MISTEDEFNVIYNTVRLCTEIPRGYDNTLYICFSLETSGINYKKHQIIQLSANVFHRIEEKDTTFSTKTLKSFVEWIETLHKPDTFVYLVSYSKDHLDMKFFVYSATVQGISLPEWLLFVNFHELVPETSLVKAYAKLIDHYQLVDFRNVLLNAKLLTMIMRIHSLLDQKGYPMTINKYTTFGFDIIKEYRDDVIQALVQLRST
jgi:hypothetical protein